MANQVYARPALLITHTRSGGTMLNYALSTHPRIFWTRGEPLLRQMEWGKAFPDASDIQILECITRASFYTVAGCKITYEQLTQDIWEWIAKKKVRVLHLVRENMIRVIVSQIITGMVASQRLPEHRAHSFEKLEPVKISVNPSAVIAKMVQQEADVERKRARLTDLKLPMLELTYQELTGQQEVDRLPDAISEKICSFLGVRLEPLRCDLKRVNSAPLSEIVENWPELEARIRKTKYKEWLDG